jgi:5-hydroxyisourate hydrolase-like protein (transthyretin family)
MALVTASVISASAENITGTVTNATSGKPSAGDEVTLLSLSQGMQEVGSAKTDAQGKFSLAAPADTGTPHMVRVTHQGVNYFPQGGPLMPGSTSAQITVYDTAKQIEGLSQTVEVDRFEAQGDQLQGITLFAIRNESKPPRTLDADQTFEFVLPPGAMLDQGMAKSPGGQPLNMSPVETTTKGRYAFRFPLKPGETQFQVSYHMPYKGELSFSPKPLAEVQHFVVMTPPGMTFAAKDKQRYQSMPDNSGASVMVATNVKPGEDLGFTLSGTGQFAAEGQQAAGGDGGGQPAGRDNRPGGGLGAPIDSDDPLHDYRAVILGVFALVLVMGGAYVVAKSNTRVAATAGSPVSAGAQNSGANLAHPAGDKGGPPQDRNTKLLEAMKEELFQLELDRQQGKITHHEYDKAKAALDETIRRAVARKSSN